MKKIVRTNYTTRDHTNDTSPVIWTAVERFTSIGADPRHAQPKLWSNWWLENIRNSRKFLIWLPVDRRGVSTAVASSQSRMVIGGSSGAMTMLALRY
jgi:hypothetical protein